MTAKAEIRIYLEARGAGTEKQRLRILGHLDRIAGHLVKHVDSKRVSVIGRGVEVWEPDDALGYEPDGLRPHSST